MRSIVVEGWRLIPHSYAVVSQYQCLELLKRADVQLFHRDVPYLFPHWTRTPGIWAPDIEARLAGIPAPPPDLKPDAVLRMGSPHFLEADPRARRTVCWGTSEFGEITASAIGSGAAPRAALSGATARIVTCSQWARMGFINSGARESNIRVIHCGADPERFKPAPAETRTALRKQFGWEGRFVVLNVSAMTSNKGVDLAMRVVAELSDRHPALLLVLKGSDALYGSAQFVQSSLATVPPSITSKLAAHVHYTGTTLTEASMVTLYQAADAYLSPYRAEGFNLPVLEATACGLPVICTRGGSTDDFVDEDFALRVDAKTVTGTSGRLWLEPDVDDLSRQLNRMITDHGFRDRARVAGPEWVRSRFTWKQSVDALMAAMFD